VRREKRRKRDDDGFLKDESRVKVLGQGDSRR
jgi:hypothetical protein